MISRTWSALFSWLNLHHHIYNFNFGIGQLRQFDWKGSRRKNQENRLLKSFSSENKGLERNLIKWEGNYQKIISLTVNGHQESRTCLLTAYHGKRIKPWEKMMEFSSITETENMIASPYEVCHANYSHLLRIYLKKYRHNLET